MVGPGRSIYGKGVQPGRTGAGKPGSPKAGPKNVNYRVHPTPMRGAEGGKKAVVTRAINLLAFKRPVDPRPALRLEQAAGRRQR